MSADAGARLTGRHVLIIMVAAFGVIVAVNLTLAWFATGSFPGLVVRNSYVASQVFDQRRSALMARHWRTEAGWREGVLALRITDETGNPVRGLVITARLGRPASALGDRSLLLEERRGRYSNTVPLAPGRWLVAFRIDDGTGEPVDLQSLIVIRGGA